jgi:hypothetical protein
MGRISRMQKHYAVFSFTLQIIANSEALIKYAMDYSLELSSSSPLDFAQHQIFCWIYNAWATVDNGKTISVLWT